MTERENYIRAVRFERPDYIPVFFAVNPSCYFTYDQDFLFGEMERHKLLFPNFVRPEKDYVPELSPICKAREIYYDAFGCRWETAMDGILGTVVEHPLADLDGLPAYRFPDAEKTNGVTPVDWRQEKERLTAMREEGGLVQAGLRHGHTFLQMCDIRGYENFIFDMMDEAPYLGPFLEKLTDFNLSVMQHYLDIGVDVFQIPEDLGMQIGPMLSVQNFEKYILPCYRRLTAPLRRSGVLVHMHSDGDIRLLAEGLMSTGVDILNLQDNTNGVEWIKENLKGKVCIDLDLDRQKVTRFGTPEAVAELVRCEISLLNDRRGGLMLTYGLYPGIPEKNVVSLMDALERYMRYE